MIRYPAVIYKLVVYMGKEVYWSQEDIDNFLKDHASQTYQKPI